MTLLHAGADVNIGPGNALTSWLKQKQEQYQFLFEEELALLLFASGERLNKEEIEEVPDDLQPPEEMTLMHFVQRIHQKTSAADE